MRTDKRDELLQVSDLIQLNSLLIQSLVNICRDMS